GSGAAVLCLACEDAAVVEAACRAAPSTSVNTTPRRPLAPSRAGGSSPWGCVVGWDIEAVVKRSVLAVVYDYFQLPFRLGYEAEGDDRVRAHGDVRIKVEDRSAFVGRIDGADEAGRCVVTGDLVHLHPVEVGMSHHEDCLLGFGCHEIADEVQFHAPDVGQCRRVVASGRC